MLWLASQQNQTNAAKRQSLNLHLAQALSTSGLPKEMRGESEKDGEGAHGLTACHLRYANGLQLLGQTVFNCPF